MCNCEWLIIVFIFGFLVICCFFYVWEALERGFGLISNSVPGYVLKNSQDIKINDFIRNAISEIKSGIDDEMNGPVFLIGEWGSGKTTILNHVMKEVEGYEFVSKSFFSINDLSEAYLHLLSFGTRLFFSLLAVFVSFGFAFFVFDLKNLEVFKFGTGFVVLVFSYLIITNKYKFLYVIGSSVETDVCKKKRVVVIEDLDRSSLSEADKWALLSNLWTEKTRYIVGWGYEVKNYEERERLSELAIKLGGKVVYLPISFELVTKVIEGIDPDFPFANVSWADRFSTRDWVAIALSVKSEARNKSKLYKTFWYLKKMIEMHSLRGNFSYSGLLSLTVSTVDNKFSVSGRSSISDAQKIESFMRGGFEKLKPLNSTSKCNT